jgi:hypothetical protein
MITSRSVFNLVSLIAFLMSAATLAPAQKPQKAETGSVGVRSSAAYAEVLLRRTELESELESLLMEFTEEYPKVKANRHSLAQLQKQADILLATKAAEASKLTLALGKMIVRKVELETDLWALQQTLADGHPDVKRAKRRVEIYDNAIKEILG